MEDVTSIFIRNILVHDTGEYHNIMIRPYQPNIRATDINEIANKVDQYGGGRGLPEQALASIASGIIVPSATAEGMAKIPNGWNQRRLRFIIELECHYITSGKIVYYLQGYTSHPGMTAQGNIDETMEFILNSYIGVAQQAVIERGRQVMKDVIVESSHVMADHSFTSMLTPENRYLTRPEDIFNGIKYDYLNNGHSSIDGNSLSLNNHSMLTTNSKASERGNMRPAHWLAKVISSYAEAMDTYDYTSSHGELYDSARAHCAESTLYSNPALRAFNNDDSNPEISNRFRYSHLLRIDPNVYSKIKYVSADNNTRSSTRYSDNSQHWNGTDAETQTSTLLIHSVTSLMLECFLTQLQFTSNSFIDPISRKPGIETTIIHGSSFLQTDMSQHYDIFKNRFHNEILKDITFNGKRSINLMMRVDIFGDTQINISLDGQTPTPFASPSFADASHSPMIAMDRDNYSNTTNSIELLINNTMPDHNELTDMAIGDV